MEPLHEEMQRFGPALMENGENWCCHDICNIATVNLEIGTAGAFGPLIWGDEESAVFYIIDNYIFIKLYEKFPAEK